MAKAKEEQIFIQIGQDTIELTGLEKETFLEQRVKDQLEVEEFQTKLKEQKTLRKSAYTKLGLTEEEINAIL